MTRSRSTASFGKVPFLFGACLAEALPGPVLVRLLTDLDATPGAAKAMLHRMTSFGLLSMTRHGTVGVYRLAGPMIEGYDRVRDAAPPRPWDGRLHVVIHDIPETRRSVRQGLLTAAARLGYRQLRSGVLVGTGDASAALGSLLEDPGVVTAWLDVDAAASTSIVRRCWDLDDVAARYRAVTARLLAVAARTPPAGAEALRVLHDSTAEAYLLLIDDARLPTSVVPAGWPVGALSQALARLNATLGPAAHDHASAVIAASPHAHLVRADPHGPVRA